jgi:exodeoxyribonuclease VII small subunit
MDQSPIDDMKFETALADLENIVSSMENGKLELDASIAAFRRGMALSKHCQAKLAAAEAQIRILENGETSYVDRNTLEAQ